LAELEEEKAVPWIRQQLPAFHHGGSGSVPGQSMWDLWWT